MASPNLLPQRSMGFFGRPNCFLYNVPRFGTKIPLQPPSLLSSPYLCPLKRGPVTYPQVSPAQPPSQEHNKRTSPSLSTPLLLKAFPSKKEGQLFPSSLGSLSPQQIFDSSPLQNGIYPVHSIGYRGVPLGLCNGLGRGILPFSSRLAFPPLFRLRPGQPRLRFSVPPLRARSSLWAFNRITNPIKSHLHLRAIKAHSYLDDFLFMASSLEGLKKVISYVMIFLNLCLDPGF